MTNEQYKIATTLVWKIAEHKSWIEEYEEKVLIANSYSQLYLSRAYEQLYNKHKEELNRLQQKFEQL